jgi:hypothetical protein
VDHHLRIDGLLPTSRWPEKNGCVEDARRVRLPDLPLPESLSLAIAWCNDEMKKPGCYEMGSNSDALPRPLWNTVLQVDVPAELAGGTATEKPLGTNLENLLMESNLINARTFLEAFPLDPMVEDALHAQDARLAGDLHTSLRLRKSALYRYFLSGLIEQMIPFALSGFMQANMFQAIQEAGQLHQPATVAGQVVMMAWSMVPQYPMVRNIARSTCGQGASLSCRYMVNTARKIRPDRSGELALMAWLGGNKTLALQLSRDAEENYQNALALLVAAEKNPTEAQVLARKLKEAGQLSSALVLYREHLSVEQLILHYTRLGEPVDREQVRMDAYWYLDHGNAAAFSAMGDFFQRRFIKGN